jgi:hypothetical protein
MKLITIGTLALAAFALADAASAAPPSKFGFNGSMAGAVFEGEEGCLSTFASVFASDFQIKGEPPGSVASIFASIRDTCLDQEIRQFDGTTDLAPADFTVNSSGSLAVLKATIVAHDFVSDTWPAPIGWSGVDVSA